MINKRNSVFALILLLAISAFFASTLPNTGFDYNFDKFFKPDDQATKYFQIHRDTFSTDNDFILVGLVNEAGVFETDFLTEIEELTAALKEMPHITSVLSPTNAKVRVREPLTGSVFQRPLLSGKRDLDSNRVFSDPSVLGNLFSTDTTAISIVAMTKEFLNKDESDELAESLNAILSNYDFDGVHLSGRAIGQVVFIKKIQSEFVMFMSIAMGFVVVLLFIMFRSFRGVILPIFTVLLAVIWSVGILNLAGKGISILLNMLPPVIFVVGMSDAVHLYSRYLEELKKGLSKKESIKLMTTDTGLATLLTSITTSIGFASLWFTGIPSLQEFGVLTAVGVMAAFVIAIIMMPACLTLFSEPKRYLESNSTQKWDGFLLALFNVVTKNRKKIFITTGLLSVAMIAGITTIDLNNYLLEDLKKSEKLRQDFTFFDQYFSGVRPFDMGLEWDNEVDLSDPEYFQSLDKIHHFLEANYRVGAVMSPLSVLKELNRSNHGGRNEFYRLPEKEGELKLLLKDYKKILSTGKISNLTTEDGGYIRVLGRVGDLGAQHFASKNEELNDFLEREGIAKNATVTITGTGTLIDRTNQTLVESLSKGLGAAFILISILMGLMFRSFRMVLIALVPNLLPLLAVGAVMALAGINLNMSTSIIFTIAFGIAVDDTIHLLSRYKLELMKGKSQYDAMRNAYLHTGKALIITSIILFGGFIGLCFSSFQSTFFIGLFVTLTLGFALLFDFTLLPPLVISKENK
ncbi:MAG: putative RND superfamily exporter protein [Cryomorphaceae bacterium]|jgi:predicted RND superfamily exporter protein